MDSTKFSLERTEEVHPSLNTHIYTKGASGMHLLASEYTDPHNRRVELAFWDGPIDGAGRRLSVASVDLNFSYGDRKSTVSMSGASWCHRDPGEVRDFMGALEVAGAWFSLLRMEAAATDRELVQAGL